MTPSPTAARGPFGGFFQSRSATEVFALICSVLVPVAFVLYTHQVWEDFLIAYRYAENLASGHGLVFTPGERVYGFTAILNTLLPAFFAWLTQASDFFVPLQLYRLTSLAGLLLSFAVIGRVMLPAKNSTPLLRGLGALFPLLAVLEIKITAYTMNGMEAGFMLGFLAPVFVLAFQGWPRDRVVLGGICIAGLMYTRADGFIYVIAATFSGLAFSSTPRRAMVNSIARSIGLSILLYLPWMIFAQSYYGSFIPHTIVAKRGTEAFVSPAFGLFAPVAAGFAKLPERMCGVFAAIYDYQRAEPGAWPKWVHDVCFALEFAAVTYWLVPTGDRLGRMASLCSLVILCYLTYASLIAAPGPWYYPSLSFFSLLALLRMMLTLPGYLGERLSGAVSTLLVTATICFLSFIFVYSLRALRLKQEIIDGGHRREIGLWLRENVRDHETVYMEPLGYIGYFSQRKIRDWPGLISPEVVAARAKIGPVSSPWGAYIWGRVAEEIQPDWLVARPVDTPQIEASKFLKENYQLVRVFNAAEPIIAAGEFYGSFITYNDAVFQIFQKRPPAPVSGTEVQPAGQ